MKKILNRMKLVFLALMVVVSAGPVRVSGSAFAEGGSQETIQNAPARTLGDGVVLSKTAKAVEGMVNTWDVTLRIESPKTSKTSDTVIVIDRSGSMNSDSKISEAKKAAKSLAQQLLPAGNETNRIAIVTFASDVSVDLNFSASYSAVSSAIDAITPEGGTFTQAGIHKAAALLSSSTADFKNIILLSDGEPTYNYELTDPDEYLVDGGPGWHTYEKETGKDIPQSAFDYDSMTGAGNDMWDSYDQEWIGGSWLFPTYEYHYYNSGNCAIVEAGYYKNSNNGDLYTIALNAGTQGNAVLNQMASTGKAYTATVENLKTIFDDIAGFITSVVQSASVEDLMGDGVVISSSSSFGVSGADELNWTPEFEYDATIDKYVAEITYRVEITEDIVGADNEGGFYPLNDSATITYNGNQTGAFPVPKVKPVFVEISKRLEGQTCANCTFDVSVKNPGKYDKTYTLKAGQTKLMAGALPVGIYTVTEVSTANNPVKFENYLISYSQKSFTISGENDEDVKIEIVNLYETKDVTASKYWDDAENQDGFRKNYNLYVAVKDGDTYVDYAKISNDITEQSFTFEDLPKNYNNAEIEYTVEEAKNCTTSNGVISCEKFEGDYKYIVSINDGNAIVNQHTPETINITINKDWNDDNNRDGLRWGDGIVEFCVTGGGKRVCKNASNLLNQITITFENLPKYSNGVEISYSVEEVNILGGYHAVGLPESAVVITNNAANINVTNVHEPEKINVVVKTEWNDDEDKDGVRPDSYTVTLKHGDTVIDSKTITRADAIEGKCDEWCVEFTNLYKYENGEKIEYTIESSEVADYTTKIGGSMDGAFVVVHSHETEFDPCSLGGCGSVIPPEAPDTGRVTNGTNETVNYTMGYTMVVCAAVLMLIFGVRKDKKEN